MSWGEKDGEKGVWVPHVLGLVCGHVWLSYTCCIMWNINMAEGEPERGWVVLSSLLRPRWRPGHRGQGWWSVGERGLERRWWQERVLG